MGRESGGVFPWLTTRSSWSAILWSSQGLHGQHLKGWTASWPLCLVVLFMQPAGCRLTVTVMWDQKAKLQESPHCHL